MPVHRVKFGLRRTAEEPMVCTLTWPNGVVQRITNVDIPPTDVDRLGFGKWQVRKCVGQDVAKQCVVELPEEHVLLDETGAPWQWTFDAQPIKAPITITVPDGWGLTMGSVGIGTVLFPLCKTNLFTGVAEEVHALGSVVFP